MYIYVDRDTDIIIFGRERDIYIYTCSRVEHVPRDRLVLRARIAEVLIIGASFARLIAWLIWSRWSLVNALSAVIER